MAGKTLPLATEVQLHEIRGYWVGTGRRQAHRGIAPEHIRLNVGESRREPQKQVGRCGRVSRRQRPVVYDDADHALICAHLVWKTKSIQGCLVVSPEHYPG